MATLTESLLAPILKELYPNGADETLIYKNHPLMGMITHDRSFGGRYKRVPIRYGKPVSTSASFSTAQTNASTSKYEAFNVTRVKRYGVAKIDGDAVDLSKTGDDSIFLDDLQAEIDGILSKMGDDLAKEIYRSSGGSRGRVGSGTSSPITLSNPEDIIFFEVGMVISANDTDNGTTLRSGTGTITAIDEDAGTITYSGTITSLAVGDYLFQSGDEGTTMSGLDSWVPGTAPTSGDSFFGVDRSVSTRLSGIRFAGGAFGFEEFFIKAKARVSRGGASQPDYWFMNPKDLANFELAVAGQKEVVESSYNMGFEAIRAYGVKLMADPDCPVGITWGIPMDCFWWSTLGDAPRIINEDGLELQRSASADEYELRVVAKGNCMSDAPGLIVRGVLPT